MCVQTFRCKGQSIRPKNNESNDSLSCSIAIYRIFMRSYLQMGRATKLTASLIPKAKCYQWPTSLCSTYTCNLRLLVGRSWAFIECSSNWPQLRNIWNYLGFAIFKRRHCNRRPQEGEKDCGIRAEVVRRERLRLRRGQEGWQGLKRAGGVVQTTPNLVKFHQFRKIYKVFGKILKLLMYFWWKLMLLKEKYLTNNHLHLVTLEVCCPNGRMGLSVGQ